MSKTTARVRVAVGERLQPVGEIVFEADGRRQTSMFRYAVEWLENSERFAIAPSMPLSEAPFYRSASRENLLGALPGPIGDGAPDSWGRGLIRKALGGARPKANVRDESGDLAIAKFTSDDDTMPVGAGGFSPRLSTLIRSRTADAIWKRVSANSAATQPP